MTDSLKLAEMQRTNIEFERQRHLANWLIKSSPHMGTPPPSSSSSSSQQQHQVCTNNSSVTATIVTTAVTTTAAANTTTPPPPNPAIATTTTTNNSASSTTVVASVNSTSNGVTTTTSANLPTNNLNGSGHTPANNTSSSATNPTTHHSHHFNAKHGSSGCVTTNNTSTTNPVFYLMASNGNTGAVGNSANVISSSNVTTTTKHTGPFLGPHAHHPHTQRGGLHHLAEGRKAKLRRFNSHDTSSNMFSVADFENARLARRNEIELKQRLQRRLRHGYGSGNNAGLLNGASNGQGLLGGGMTDYSTGDSKISKNSNESQNDPLQVEEFLERYSLPRVVRISYKTLFSNETLQSSSSNNSSTVTSSSSSSAKNAVTSSGVPSSDTNMISSNSNSNTGTSSSTTSSGLGVGGGGGGGVVSGGVNPTSQTLGSNSSNNSATKSVTNDTNPQANDSNQNAHDEDQGELFLLYRLVRQRNIYHGHNSKTTVANRKKGVMIPQEFPGYFSLLNDKGMATATLYTSLVQLVRERVCKFISVDNMPAFMESQTNGSTANSPTEGCLNIYSSNSNNANSRPQYIKTTARGGQVFKLLAVYEDGKQEHTSSLGSTISCGGLGSSKPNSSHGREKERSRYAQLLNEQRQTVYVSLATKGKFYEIEPGIPQILQKRLDMTSEAGQKKINPDCVHRITALICPTKELPMTLKYISGPNGCANAIPENICISRITTENIIIACPIEDVEMQSPLHLRKLHLTKEMNLVKNCLGFENEQRMLANPNVQNILKFCQFNCDQFLKMVEVEILQRSERSISKSREGLKILKPLHFPKLLRREKTTISAHEKEDSIIFLSKSDLQNLENKEQAFDQQANRISEKMKVFQSTKKKWFRKQDKNSVKSLTSLDLDVQAKKMSMERYSDMSKLLQERFGDKTQQVNSEQSECISELSAGNSDLGCSDTETTTLATINEKFNKFSPSKMMGTEPNILQKSMSLQDIDVIGRQMRKPDLLASHHTTDTISEAGTDIEDMENREPLPTSFITEKLFNEFHVKTKQYSKSSSSLHQLLNFSLPQKMQIGENKRSLAQLKTQNGNKSFDKRLEFNIGEPVTGRRAAGGLSLLGPHNSQSQNTSLMSPLSPSSYIEDDLPYSSVRDSLVLSSDEGSPPDVPASAMRQALNLLDYTKENIYAEICHDASAMGGIPSSQTRDTFSGATHSTQISDDYGDYASLCYPPHQPTVCNNLGSAISRVQINCSASPVSYHTVYLGDEPLGEQYAAERAALKQKGNSHHHHQQHHHHHRNSRDRSHITTVDVAAHNDNSLTAGAASGPRTLTGSQSESGGLDNIYNTLK